MTQHFQNQPQNYPYRQPSKQWINGQPVQPPSMSNPNGNRQGSIESWLGAQTQNLSSGQWAAASMAESNKQSGAGAEFYQSSVNAPVHQFVNQPVPQSGNRWAMAPSRGNDLPEQSYTTPAAPQAFKGQGHPLFMTKEDFKILRDEYVDLLQILQYRADKT